MAENSNIEWTDHTFNPWIGCQKVSPGCDHCYAETWDARGLQGQARRWGPHADRTRTSPGNWNKPRAWNRAAAAAGKRARVFCASLADVFDNHPSIKDQWRADLWELIAETPHLDWLLLTKRPQNIIKMLPDRYNLSISKPWGQGWPNVWLGTTVENQAEADRRIPHLLAVPARVRFLSCEPLLGPVDLTEATRSVLRNQSYLNLNLHWVIAGGESGQNARPMNPYWAETLRDQCVAAGVAFHFKQWGEWGPEPPPLKTVPRSMWHDACGLIQDTIADPHPLDFFCEGFVFRVGKKAAGRLLDGRTWDEVPA